MQQMKLTIEVPCTTGIEMEERLNKAIDHFSQVLEQRGFSEIWLEGGEIDTVVKDGFIYVIKLQPCTPYE